MAVLEVDNGPQPVARGHSEWVLPVSLLFAADKALAMLCTKISFPSPLIGMGLLLAALLAAAAAKRPSLADAAETFFRPGVDWIAHQWLPVFYVPALVTIPMAVAALKGAILLKAAAVVLVGMPLVLLFTAAVALLIRRARGTQAGHWPYHATLLEVTWRHWAGWGGLAAASLLLTALLPARTAPFTAFPFLLAATVLGYLAGLALPPRVQTFIHPVLVCGAAPNVGAAVHGVLTGAGYWATLEGYLTKGRGLREAFFGYGPGDLLFSFLGPVILSFAWKVYEQRAALRRHATEVAGACAGSALFAMLTTAGAARAAGLPGDVARGLVPRSVTMALALPIAAQLDAPQAVTAGAVVLTGMAGAALVVPLLGAARIKDPVARGLAASAAAHGLGTAALAAHEPEALPFCALGYALTGVAASVLAALPPVRVLLLAVAG